MSDSDNDDRRSRSNAVFGATIRHLRTERELTQAQLAELADLATDTIQRLENGKFSPTLHTMRLLASALGMRLSELFDELEKRPTSAATSDP